MELEQVATLTNKGWIIKAGINWSSICWQSLIEKLNNYVKMYEDLNEEQCDDYWCQQVGGAQLMLPAHVINVYSRPLRSLSWNSSTEDINLSRTGISDWRTGGYGNKLGSSFGRVRGQVTSGGRGVAWGFVINDHRLMADLLNWRSQQAHTLVSTYIANASIDNARPNYRPS